MLRNEAVLSGGPYLQTFTNVTS